MEADKDPRHELMRDIVAVEWLPLKAAIRRLSYPLEKLFLRHAAARAIAPHKRGKEKDKDKRKGRAKRAAGTQRVPKKSGAAAQQGKKPKLKPAKKSGKKSGKKSDKNKRGKKN